MELMITGLVLGLVIFIIIFLCGIYFVYLEPKYNF